MENETYQFIAIEWIKTANEKYNKSFIYRSPELSGTLCTHHILGEMNSQKYIGFRSLKLLDELAAVLSYAIDNNLLTIDGGTAIKCICYDKKCAYDHCDDYECTQSHSRFYCINCKENLYKKN